jgi:transcriptional regulator with XRE-family HTH domain
MLLRVRRLRLEKGLHLRRAADLLGVAAPVLSSIESGRQVPWPALRARMADLYEYPERELFVDIDAAQAFLRRTAGESPP